MTVALTPNKKCFEKLLREYFSSTLPASLDPQFRSNVKTDCHGSPHMDSKQLKGKCLLMLFVGYSSAFNTIDPAKFDPRL